MSKFQFIVIGIFAAAVVIGVIFISAYRGNSVASSKITIWGIIPESYFNTFLMDMPVTKDKTLEITYKYVKPEEFDNSLIEAMADGVAPDVVFLPTDGIVKNINRIFPIPYNSLPERTFKDTFIPLGEMFLSNSGILALPFMTDPMVMYWNRTMYTSAGISQPVKYWSDFSNIIPKLTKKDGVLNIKQSAVALGESKNITNSKEILSTLFMQSGDTITVKVDNEIRSYLGEKFDFISPPAEVALNFYTDFSNSKKLVYSWNKSMPNSTNYFLSGELATYFGFASESFSLREKNPNLDFDVAVIPQPKDVTNRITFGRMYGLAAVKTSKDLTGALRAMTTLVGKDYILKLSNVIGLPPVRRDLIASKSGLDPFMSVFYDSALISKGWFDPDKDKTKLIFDTMIDSVLKGSETVEQALKQASTDINFLLKK